MPADRKPTMYELRAMQRRLQVMDAKCNGDRAGAGGAGGGGDKDPYEIDEEVLRGMSPFEQDELRLAMALRKFRDTMEEVQELGKGKSSDDILKHPRLARKRQELRKMEADLRPKQRALIAAARSDEEKRRCKEALGHLNNMRKRYDRQRTAFEHAAFGSGRGDAAGAAAGDDLYDDRRYGGPAAAGGSPAAPLLASIDDVGQGANLREDEEFAMFFEQIAKQDQRIDQALDRIHAGTLALKENALMINRELKVQAQLLDETEEKVAAVTEKVTSLNKRVKKAVKEVESDKVCIYLICCILLLGVTGFILVQLKVVKT